MQKITLLFLLIIVLFSCQPTANTKVMQAQPPKAKKIPKVFSEHGNTRTDNYFWMNERENPEVINYLKAENAYLDTMLMHTKPLQARIFEEIKGRIKQDDNSVPVKLYDFYYYTRYETGKEYPIFCRKKTLQEKEEVMFDGNEAAKDKAFFAVMGASINKAQDIWAFATDTVGRRICTIQFKELKTGKLLADVIPNVTGNFTWANDNQTVFYTKQDPQTLRSYQVWRHTLGTDSKQDVLIFEEKDDTYSVSVGKTKSRKYIVINSGATLSNEWRFLEADNPKGNLRIFEPRTRNIEYSIDHAGDAFYVLTNWNALNFRLMTCGEDKTQKSEWKEKIPHRADVLLEDMEISKNNVVLQEKSNGLTKVRILTPANNGDYYLPIQEETYSIGIGANLEYDTDILRYNYQSLTTPSSVFDFDMRTQKATLMKQTEVVGGYNAKEYQSARVWATAADGTKIPISLVYKKTTPLDGSAPLLLYGYGSYGYSMEPYFSISRLSLLDRGFVYAIAHVRGGEEMGRKWYDDGKLLKKKNTFTDFIACGEFLVEKKYGAKDKMCMMGGSAGGLLMGAVMNLRPDMWKAVVAQVPFVDVMTTMLDASIPLTTGEYDEWGNPNEKQYYDYMLTYSPYDNVTAKAYPNVLVTSGLHDSQVQYFEPTKWVAKLRELKTDNNMLLLHTNMDAGHGGASGRFEIYKETALEYAFLLDRVAISK